ncbi:MAG: GMC family oxidoreductase N-terminal domain-containing protein [Bacteroidaceae bacterium]|nr:GMC family oxidoreductase N-terminal domain-containing protein [Bacteroidaceae bacterium]
MKKVIVIGSGAGGAMAARMLARDFDVTVLEAGGEFKPLALPLDKLAMFRKTGLYFDERLIQLLLPSMRIDKQKEMIMVYGRGVGGTTTLATGNAVRADEGLKRIGICLDDEFDELSHELPVTTAHQRFWSQVTKKTFQVMQQMDLDPQPMPKFLRPGSCRLCGHCSIGCPSRAKWDARELLDGIRVEKDCRVTRIEISDNKAKKVHAVKGLKHLFFDADVVIVAAGGYGTPDVLRASGIDCQPTLFVDPVLCVAATMQGVKQNRQLLMPFVSRREKYIISPYMDWLSFFFNRSWRKPMDGIVSLMIKLADVEQGDVHKGKMEKLLTPLDHQRLAEAADICREILMRMGADKNDIFLGTLNAGHPGGMLPLTEAEASTLHSPLLPHNLYVCDASILPQSLGLPPMLTIMALAKRISKIIAANWK